MKVPVNIKLSPIGLIVVAIVKYFYTASVCILYHKRLTLPWNWDTIILGQSCVSPNHCHRHNHQM